MASPVWFQIKPETFEFGGRHDVDLKWIESVKSFNGQIKFVPRIIFENWGPAHYQSVLSDNNKRTDCIKAIRGLVKASQISFLNVFVHTMWQF